MLPAAELTSSRMGSSTHITSTLHHRIQSLYPSIDSVVDAAFAGRQIELRQGPL
jgi:hypothetical protein